MSTSANYQMMSGSRLLAAYLGDIRFEFVKMARTPAFAVPTLFFPAMFYVLFGVIMGHGQGPDAALNVFARMGVFGTMAPGLFGFGVSLAFEREYGLLTFKQALPTPPGSYLLARMVMAMLFASVISSLLIVLALFLAHAPITGLQAIEVFCIEVLGVLPFCAIGLFVGSLASGQAAPAIVNIIYLPMAFLSGLWVPFQYLPVPMLKEIAPLWPSFHLSQIAMHALGQESFGTLGGHVAALAGVTLLFFTLAMRRLSSGGLHMFGARKAAAGLPLGKAFTMAILAISIGLVLAGLMSGHEKLAAATSKDGTEQGAGSPVTDSSSAAAVGVAAPASPLIADFDAGDAKASYGIGFTATDDKSRGGNSAVSQKIVDGGAEGSKGALEVTGQVGDAIQYPFVGTSFLPNGSPGTDFGKQGTMDYSGRHNLRFFARGDGQSYTVVIMGPQLDTIPAMYSFQAGPEWRAVTVPVSEIGNIDLKRVKVISIGSMKPGPFRFEIDAVRIE